MVAPSAKAQRIIRIFLTHLKKKINVKEVYLFGSQARGKVEEHSDIDLAIVSPDFKKMEPFERLVFLGRVAWEAGTPIVEAIGYTPTEFYKASKFDFPHEIKGSGISIYEAA